MNSRTSLLLPGLLAAVIMIIPANASASPFAYITDSCNGALDVVDTATDIAAPPIKVGNAPGAVAVNPAGTRVYVTNYNDNTVSVVDVTSRPNQVIATIPVGRQPVEITINPAGTRVYVSDSGGQVYNNQVSVIDTASNTVVATITGDNAPSGLAVNPSGTTVYVANGDGTSTLSVIDASTNTITQRVPLNGSFGVSGVVVNPSGTRVYISGNDSRLIHVLDTATNTIIDEISVNARPSGLALTPDGSKLYVAMGFHANEVSVIDTSSDSVASNIPITDDPISVEITPDRKRAYVVAVSNVLVLDTATNAILDTFSTPCPGNVDNQFIGGGNGAGSGTTAPRPVVIIPGIMGSNLDRSNDGIVWLDADTAAFDFVTGTDTSDSFLFSLLLQSDGISVDTNNYCTLSKTPCVNVGGSCLFGGTCVPGGTAIVPNGPIDISFLGQEVLKPYNDLANSLQARPEHYDVSIFPYDWRLDIASQVYPLRLFLDNLLASQPSGQQVDVVAHSLGGLLLRAYLQKFPDDHRIHSVTYLGTPQAGAPIAYAKLMGSASLIDKFGANICLPNSLSLPLCLNLDTETFVSMHFPTVYELLPRTPFISVNEGGIILLEPLGASFARLSEPSIARFYDLVSSQLLDEANNLYATGLAGRNSVPRSFAINGTKHTTLVGIDFTDSGCPRGIPEFDSDGTVPHLSSATFLPPGANFYVDAEHRQLPANPSVAQQIANILSGNENSLASGITTSPLADATCGTTLLAALS
jgi:YVTN family beta-propeller protein